MNLLTLFVEAVVGVEGEVFDMFYYVVCGTISTIGIYTTYKIIKNQDFDKDTQLAKWCNYISASFAMGWSVPALLAVFTYHFGKTLISIEHLLLGLIVVVIVFVINAMADYKGCNISRMFCIDRIRLL